MIFFLKYKTLQAAMRGKKCLAVLYQVHDRKKNVQNEAGHFILINTAGKVPEYFSSSGWAVGKEVAALRYFNDSLVRIL